MNKRVPRFKSPVLRELTTENGYHFKVVESDPYYHVAVSKDGKHVEDHLTLNLIGEIDSLKRWYEKDKSYGCPSQI